MLKKELLIKGLFLTGKMGGDGAVLSLCFVGVGNL